MVCNYFLPFWGLSVHFLDCVVGSTKVLNFDAVQLMCISFAPCAFGVMFKKAFPSPRSQRLTPVFSSKDFIVLALMLRSVVRFDYVLCTV